MKKVLFMAIAVTLALLCSACSNGEKSSINSSSSSEESVSNQSDGLSEQEAEAYYTEMISKQYSDTIFQLKCFDTDDDGNYSCAALIGKDDCGVIAGKVLFINTEGVAKVLDDKSYWNQLQVVRIENDTLIIVEESYGGSGSSSHVWKTTDSSCELLDYSFSALKHTDNNNFCAIMHTFEPFHIRKPYYFYWDGNGFKEYGGVYITEKELTDMRGGAEALRCIRDRGYTVTDIIYRANGLININCEIDDQKENMTLISVDDMFCIDINSDMYVGKADWSYGGVYLTASKPEIAVYPVL